MTDTVEQTTPDDDFLAFWRTHRAAQTAETKRILGVDVITPTDLPLAVEDLATSLQDSEDPADIARLVEMLFGADIYGQWKTNGVTTQMLKVLLAWGMANGAGSPMTFAEAAQSVAEAEAASEGKARPVANRADRRASSTTPASGASTKSPRKASRR